MSKDQYLVYMMPPERNVLPCRQLMEFIGGLKLMSSVISFRNVLQRDNFTQHIRFVPTLIVVHGEAEGGFVRVDMMADIVGFLTNMEGEMAKLYQSSEAIGTSFNSMTYGLETSAHDPVMRDPSRPKETPVWFTPLTKEEVQNGRASIMTTKIVKGDEKNPKESTAALEAKYRKERAKFDKKLYN